MKVNSFPFLRVVINRFAIPIRDTVFILVRLVRYLVQFLTIFDNRWRFVPVPAGSIGATRDIDVAMAR